MTAVPLQALVDESRVGAVEDGGRPCDRVPVGGAGHHGRQTTGTNRKSQRWNGWRCARSLFGEGYSSPAMQVANAFNLVWTPEFASQSKVVPVLMTGTRTASRGELTKV